MLTAVQNLSLLSCGKDIKVCQCWNERASSVNKGLLYTQHQPNPSSIDSKSSTAHTREITHGHFPESVYPLTTAELYRGLLWGQESNGFRILFWHRNASSSTSRSRHAKTLQFWNHTNWLVGVGRLGFEAVRLVGTYQSSEDGDRMYL